MEYLPLGAVFLKTLTAVTILKVVNLILVYNEYKYYSHLYCV